MPSRTPAYEEEQRLIEQEQLLIEITKPYHLPFKKYGKSYSFSKVGQSPRSRSQDKKLWYPWKGLVTRNTHVKYQSPITYHSKVMAKVKVFQK